MTLRSVVSPCLAVSCLALVGCGQKVANMKVDPSTATLQAVKDTAKFTTVQQDSDGKAMKKPAAVTWASSDTSIATIAADGTATALKSGRATMTATSGKVTAKGFVVVQIPSKINTKDLSFDGFGKTQTIALQVQDDTGAPIDAATQKLTVAVTTGSSVSVDGPIGGPWTIKSLAGGPSTLTAASGSLSQTFNATVTPPAVTGLKIDPLSLRLKVGESQKLNATPLAGDQPIPGMTPTFSSTNASVTVDADGTVHGVSKGKAVVTIAVGGKQGTVNVTVHK